MIPDYYEFHFPVKIISGHTALTHLPIELRAASVSRPMLITDAGVVKVGLLDHVHLALRDSGITIGALFDQVPPESSTAVINQMAKIYHAKQCDGIIAVGGGSAIDTAKAMNILVTLGGDDVTAWCGADQIRTPLAPFFVVPTTSGTGSEATTAAVILDSAKPGKLFFISEYLLPRAAFLDTRMTLTLPPKLTAMTGMDALAHAMEASISLQKNPLSDAFAWQAISLIRDHLAAVVQNPQSKHGRLCLANASLMAGAAFSNAQVGAVHALGHATGAVAHLPHGMMMSIFLPHGLMYNLPARGAYIAEMLLPLAGADVYLQTAPENRAMRTIQAVQGLKQTLFALSGLPRCLKEAGVQRDQFDQIARLAINDGAAMMNPVEISHEDALDLLEKAYEIPTTGDEV